MLTNMTEQKLYIGLGRGTANYEYDAFGVDMTAGPRALPETWEILDLRHVGRAVHVPGHHLTIDLPVRIAADAGARARSTSSARSARPRRPP